MHKRQLFSLVCASLLCMSTVALAADDENAILPTNDKWGCTGLIQQGAAIPPVPTNDLNTLQTCMDRCDALYSSLGEQGRMGAMMRGSNYCRKSLNNLYFASVSQTITDELNQQTQQQQAAAQQSYYDKISAMIKQHQQSQANNAGATSSEESTSSDTPTNTAPTNQPAGPPDNVNW